MMTLAPDVWVTYCYPMARNETLTEAVLQALDAWPLADRKLAHRAGVTPATISKIRAGRRFGASEDTARRISSALREWRTETRDVLNDIGAAERRIARELACATDESLTTEG